MGSRRSSTVVARAAMLASCFLGGVVAFPASAGAADRAEVTPLPVEVTTLDLVDPSRPTAANGTCAELPSRALPTTVYHPTTGGPYPLVVFAHGFSATPAGYDRLLRHWASAGYVVAAPTFPLSGGTSPCGPVAGDVVNQPEDMSFVITSVLGDAKSADSPLHGLVDGQHVGAAGHSNGGITTYGLVGNTKLRDPRIDAAIIMAGTAQKFPEEVRPRPHAAGPVRARHRGLPRSLQRIASRVQRGARPEGAAHGDRR
ncbi:MAG: hypothetical protein U0W40_03660 [Acidimicrobiia bacterium]